MIDKFLDALYGLDGLNDGSSIIEPEIDPPSPVICTVIENQYPTSIDMIEDVVNTDDELLLIDNQHNFPDGTSDLVQTDDFALDNGETNSPFSFPPSYETEAANNGSAGDVQIGHLRADGSDFLQETTSSVGFTHPHQAGSAIAFGSKEEMLPYDEMYNHELGNPISNPFGIYASRFLDGQINVDDCISKPELPMDFTEGQLQEACNKICDVLHIRHLPVFMTSNVPNAQHMSIGGPFLFTLIDDFLSLNPDYAKQWIEKLGTTDIVLSDMAHEIGHAMADKYCGNLSRFMQEIVADFISGFINAKIGVDIDVARQWFMSEYDPVGIDDYPVSEKRWDIEAAGYYFGQLVGSEELKMALKDLDFLKLLRDYDGDSSQTLAQVEWDKLHSHTYNLTDSMESMLDSIKKYMIIKRL